MEALITGITSEVNEEFQIEKVDFFHIKNAVNHHTDKFYKVTENDWKLVLRRGQAFEVKVYFKEGNDHSIEDIRALLNYGNSPKVMEGTQGLMLIRDAENRTKFSEIPHSWEAIAKDIEEDSFILEVRSPCHSPVGKWEFILEIGWKGKERKILCSEPIYILFNPWNEDDLVYMNAENLLEEYVLNETGKIWSSSAVGRPWVYGQFQDPVLDVCMLILEKSELKKFDLGDPVKIARAISKLINSPDDNGVLWGRWNGKYSDGVAPSAWTGSVPILQKYLQSEKSVRYGQCWVFSGVATTVCRALGIPCRPVSNIVSGHDTNNSLTIDKYYDADNEPLDELNENIWNYHVWNEVWMARIDLPNGYGGWQAIDATPQEKSQGYYQCGPASVQAIKTGALYYNYDVTFIVAEVNADILTWKSDPESETGFTKVESDKYHIGRQLITKRPGIFDNIGEEDKYDITDHYKATEETAEERMFLYNAVRGNKLARRLYSLPSSSESDVDFKLEDFETIPIGEILQVKVHVQNKSVEERNIKIRISAASMLYNGVLLQMIKMANLNYKLKGNERETIDLLVDPEEYMEKMEEYCFIKIKSIATVTETKQTWADEDDFQLSKPRMDIQVLKSEKENEEEKAIKMKFGFSNPLNKRLTGCKINLEAPGIMKPISIKHEDVDPLGEVLVEHAIIPLNTGSSNLVATFESEELVDIVGSLLINE